MLPLEIESARQSIEEYAREFGLDFYPVIFEMVDFQTMNKLAAYSGFPTRYPHWRYGMEYEQLSKSYSYGLHRIYEMVINHDPCFAYLMSGNQLVDQKLVIAHVYGHCDFFKNNLWFSKTNRHMLNEIANHGSRIRGYAKKHGAEKVEKFLDACLSIEDLVDVQSPFSPDIEVSDEDETERNYRLKANEYMDSFINPPETLKRERERDDKDKEERKEKFPAEPERDILLFLMEYARLEDWQQDILSIVREESLYFAPQRQTKIMNEGWASYIHTHIMANHALDASEVIDYADHHSGTMATSPGKLNPYKLGLELYLDIEDRWNRGAFGREYDNCKDLRARRKWDKQLGLGKEKLFEIRRIYNDIGFIDAFLTDEFAREHQLFTYSYDGPSRSWVIASREFEEVKQKLLFQLTNFGQPIIAIQDANFQNKGILYLGHQYEGIELDAPYAEETLRNLQAIWGRPVCIETVQDGKGIVYVSQ